MSLRVEGDLTVSGKTVLSGEVILMTAANVQPNTMDHHHTKTYTQPNTTAVTETRVIHECRGTTGTIKSFRAGSIGVCTGNATITVDLRKNGVTVLSAVITLDSTNAARVSEAGAFSTASLVSGDVLEVVVTATVGTGVLGTGVFAELRVDEDYAG